MSERKGAYWDCMERARRDREVVAANARFAGICAALSHTRRWLKEHPEAAPIMREFAAHLRTLKQEAHRAIIAALDARKGAS